MAKNTLSIENARIGFRNFSGKKGKFNPEGRRNFCVFLDNELGRTLQEDGWNVRWLKPRDDQEDEQAYMQVMARFDNYPPKIIMITSRGKTTLDEESVGLLDWAEIENVDLIISPSNWNVDGRSGIKAYVKSMYVILVEDEFEKKYHDIPEDAVAPPGESMCADCGKCDSKGECRYGD